MVGNWPRAILLWVKFLGANALQSDTLDRRKRLGGQYRVLAPRSLSQNALCFIEIQFFLTGSIYSTLAVAIERYVSVCHPHFIGYSEAGKLSVAGLILFSIVFNICRFLEFETAYEERVSLLKILLHIVLTHSTSQYL